MTSAGGKLFATYLKDVATRAYVFGARRHARERDRVARVGTAGGFGGPNDSPFVFYTFNSLSVPPTIYRYDIASRASSVFRAPRVPGYDAAQFETKQVFYPSKDGTQIPMFLVHRKGLKLDGNNPTLLYGYGGFNIVVTPTFSAARIALLEQGFVYASANLRGGAEYGEEWHRQGMKLDEAKRLRRLHRGRRVADRAEVHVDGEARDHGPVERRPARRRRDQPAAGAVRRRRAGSRRHGHAALSQVHDRLELDRGLWLERRAEEFKALYAYSPLHNIRAGVKYPPTLITTADHDDRVVPAHSFKYAATLQALASPENPALIRIETKSGHGASSLTKQLEAAADIYAFLMHTLGVEP